MNTNTEFSIIYNKKDKNSLLLFIYTLKKEIPIIWEELAIFKGFKEPINI